MHSKLEGGFVFEEERKQHPFKQVVMDLLSAKVGSGSWQYLVFWYWHLDKDAQMHISLDSKKRYGYVSICPSIVPGGCKCDELQSYTEKRPRKKNDKHLPKCSRRLQFH